MLNTCSNNKKVNNPKKPNLNRQDTKFKTDINNNEIINKNKNQEIVSNVSIDKMDENDHMESMNIEIKNQDEIQMKFENRFEYLYKQR